MPPDKKSPSNKVPNNLRCVCDWGKECESFRKILNDSRDITYSGPMIRIEVQPVTSKWINAKRSGFINAIFSNINETATDSEKSVLNIGIARHHYHPKSLQYFTGTKKAWGTPLQKSEARKATDLLDETYKIQTQNGSDFLYYICPNNPRSSIRTHVKMYKEDESSSNEPPSLRKRKLVKREESLQRKVRAFNRQLNSRKSDIVLSNRAIRNQMYNSTREQAVVESQRIVTLQIQAANQKAKRKERESFIEEVKNMDWKERREEKRQAREKEAAACDNEEKLLDTISKLEVQIARTNTQLQEMKGDRKTAASTIRVQNHRKVKAAEDAIIKAIQKIKIKKGIKGITRSNIVSDAYHLEHPEAAKTWFGFHTFRELKAYIHVYFGLSPTEVHTYVDIEGEQTYEPEELSQFEQIIMAKIFMHSTPHRQRLADIYGVDRTTASRHVKTWMPKWARYGEFLSILPIPEDYFDKEVPDEYFEAGEEKSNSQTDGKDSHTDTIRKNDKMRRRQHSSKLHADAMRWLAWSSACGLSYEHTRPFGGRVDEKRLVKLHGSLGRLAFDLSEHENFAVNYTREPLKDYYSPVEKLLSCTSSILKSIPEDQVLPDESDHIIAYAEPFVDERLKDLECWFEKRHKQALAAKHVRETKPGKFTVESLHNVDELDEINRIVLGTSPQSSPGELLEQLELHEHLHQLYESKELRKTMLSAYLFMTREFRMDILHFMGSTIAREWSRGVRPLPNVWQRLAKIPSHIALLNDKGFAGTDRYYPNCNIIKTPPVMRNRKVKQYHESELKPKGELCRLRYTCEVVFSRVYELDILKDKISYSNLPYVAHAVEWGHAHANLKKPLKIPGSNSGLPEGYWD